MLSWLFERDFLPHGHCYFWRLDILWLHIASDALIAAAYFSIPVTLLYFVRKRRDIPFRGILNLFAAFIILCGTTHLFSIWTIWQPVYILDGIVKALTAAVSLLTAILLVPLVPHALNMKSVSELEAVNALLQTEIQRRSEVEMQLKQASDKAIESVRLKSQFLANMSHEIRTPMNGVIGMTEILLESPLSSMQRDAAEAIRYSAESLLTIINDILDFSKLEAKMMQLETANLDIRLTVKRTIATVSAAAEKKALKLDSHVSPEVPLILHGDRIRLQQVLINLISNAVKFTDRGEVHVDVALERQSATDTIVRFTIRDSGIGISKEAQRRLFQSFIQADSSMSRRHGGSGLGLAISKELVGLMGGEIGVDSDPDKGSTFWFTARLGNPIEDAVSSPPEQLAGAGIPSQSISPRPSNIASMHVVLAEDNHVNQQVAIRQLERLGCQKVRVAGNGREVLDLLSTAPCDVVLMDCQMPELDGFEATAEIRRREGPVRRTHIIAMTAHAIAGDRERCLAAGMDDYISKPVTIEVLRAALNRSGKSGDEPLPPLTTDIAKNAVPPVDLAILREAASDDAQFQRKLLKLYLKQTAGQVQGLEGAIAAGSLSDIEHLAHSAAGASYACGMVTIAPLMQEMESIGRSGQLAGVSDLLRRINLEFDRVRLFILTSQDTSHIVANG